MLLKNVDKTALSLQSIVIGGSMLAFSSGAYSLEAALLIIIASAETINVGFDYLATEVE